MQHAMVPSKRDSQRVNHCHILLFQQRMKPLVELVLTQQQIESAALLLEVKRIAPIVQM